MTHFHPHSFYSEFSAPPFLPTLHPHPLSLCLLYLPAEGAPFHQAATENNLMSLWGRFGIVKSWEEISLLLEDATGLNTWVSVGRGSRGGRNRVWIIS
jgi:hypothetical protein